MKSAGTSVRGNALILQLIAVSLFITTGLNAQWNQCTGSNQNTCAGSNVGIGTTTPSQPLDVNGTSIFRNNVYYGAGTAGDYGIISWAGGSPSRFLIYANAGKGLSLGTDGVADKLFIDTSGKVGIGLTSPGYKLDVSGNGRYSGLLTLTNPGPGASLVGNAGAPNYLAFDDTANAGGKKWRLGESGATPFGQFDIFNETDSKIGLTVVGNTGNVGVGSSAPAATLDVFRPAADGATILNVNGASAATGYRIMAQNNGTPVFRVGPTGYTVIDENSNVPALTVNQSGSGYGALFTRGNVGIGTSNPFSQLEVVAPNSVTYPATLTEYSSDAVGPLVLGRKARNTAASPVAVQRDDALAGVAARGYTGTQFTAEAAHVDLRAAENFSDSNQGTYISFETTPTGSTAATSRAERMRITSSGSVGIGTSNPTATLEVNGTIRATSVIGAVYQDVAEWVPTSEQLTPGTVVVLDLTQDNHVVASTRAYDTSVAGVVSAKPGILLGQEGIGKATIATTGRVRVKVDASSRPIRIGDLLVTSDKPGTAMRSEPMIVNGRSFHQPGTIIGKALEQLGAGP